MINVRTFDTVAQKFDASCKQVMILLCLSGQINGANWTKAFVKGLLAPEFNIVGGAVC